MTLTKIASTGVEDSLRWVLGANGTSDYTFTGPGLTGTVNDPTIYLTRGQTYIFQNNSGGHPFYIKTSIANGGTNDAYNTGVTNNGGGNGTEIVFTVPHDSPDILYYQCSSHASMAGQFNIAGSVADGSISTAKIADDAVTDAKLANSINAAIAANTAKTSNATHTGDVTGSTSLTIANNAVTGGKIANSSISNDKVHPSADIAGSKLADNSISLAKLEHGTSSNDGKFLRANNGADPTFETVSAGPTIANQGNNRIITATSTTDALNAEADLSYTGTSLVVKSGAHDGGLELLAANNNQTTRIKIQGKHSGGSERNWFIEVPRGSDILNFFDDSHGSHTQLIDNGDLSIVDGNLKVASGHGVDFSATGNGGATMQNELLDDYEEGTFTPSLRGNNNNSSPAITGSGQYTRVGRLVHAYVDFANVNQTYLPSGEYIQIHGLPYTCSQVAVCPEGMNYKIGFSTNYQYYFYIPSGGTLMWGYYNSNAQAYQPWGTDQWKSAGNIYHTNTFVYTAN